MRKPFLQRIDYYIIKKFLGTFFLAIALIISIAIIFDLSEHIDDFLEKKAPAKAIVFDFYLNWIPYFANLFSSLFTFIAVIFFTSKMAYNSEIIAILSSGITYKRLMRSYMVGAFIIASFSWILGNIVIPPANRSRIDFQNTYIKKAYKNNDKDIHRQLEPGLYMYMSSYKIDTDVGYKFTLERFEDRKLVSKIISDYVKWDREKNIWTIHDFHKRDIIDGVEYLSHGKEIDTTLNMFPKEFKTRTNEMETFDFWQMQEYIKNQKLRGVSNLEVYEIEQHKRTAQPFATFILTIIGAALASRKVRGGIGMQIGLGLLLSFSYIMFMQVSTVFATNGTTSPMIAVWIPNFIYTIIAVVLYFRASR